MADTSLVFNILAKDKASKAFDKLKGTALVAGAAIGAALAGGAAQMLEKSKLDGVLAAQLGASPAEAAALGKLSGQVYAAGFGEDLPAVSAAIKTAAQNGLVDMTKAGDAASKATVEKLLTVSQVVGDETERVSAAVSTMLKTGMAGSAEEAFDIITRATQAGVNKSGDLIDTLEEYPTLFRSLGLDGPQALGLINQGLQAGARNADQVADGLKELGIRAIDGSTAARDAYKLLGLDADAMIKKIAKGGPSAAKGMDQIFDALRRIEDPVKQNEAGVGLLGTKWEDMRDAVLALDLDTAAAQMDGLTGATDRAGNAIQETAGARLDRFKRQAQVALVDTLARAVPTLERIGGFVQQNSQAFLILGGVVAGVAATMLVVNAVTAAWTTIQTVAAAATKIWTAVQWLLNIAMSANPIGLVVLAVIALIAIIVLIATKTTWFQTIWKYAWGAIKAVAEWVFNWIVGGWKWAIGMLVSGAKAWWALFSGTWRQVGSLAAQVWNWITSRATSMFNNIRGGFNQVVGFIRGLPGRIRSAAAGMFNGIRDAFRSAINWIIGRWNGLSFRLPSVSIPGLGSVGGGTLSTPNIPYLATGTDEVLRSGLAVIHRGEQVLPAAQVSRSRPTGGASVLRVEAGAGGSPTDRAFADMFLHMIRTGVIQLTVDNNRVRPA